MAVAPWTTLPWITNVTDPPMSTHREWVRCLYVYTSTLTPFPCKGKVWMYCIQEGIERTSRVHMLNHWNTSTFMGISSLLGCLVYRLRATLIITSGTPIKALLYFDISHLRDFWGQIYNLWVSLYAYFLSLLYPLSVLLCVFLYILFKYRSIVYTNLWLWLQ
jgi:hypothetical protein